MEVVGSRVLSGTIKPKTLNPEHVRVAVAMVLESKTSMDWSNDKAKFSEKYANESRRPIWLDGSVHGNRCNVCAFFSDRDEEYQVLLPFVRDGLERGEKIVHTVDPERRGEHLERLRGRRNRRGDRPPEWPI
jgi:hypothetical protein